MISWLCNFSTMYTMYNTKHDQSTQQPIMLTINSNKHSTTEINSTDVTRGTHTHTHTTHLQLHQRTEATSTHCCTITAVYCWQECNSWATYGRNILTQAMPSYMYAHTRTVSQLWWQHKIKLLQTVFRALSLTHGMSLWVNQHDCQDS